MKRLYFSFLLLTFVSYSLSQPSNLQKVKESVFLLKSYNANGDIIATANGFFINNNGDAICSWEPLKGAYKATITDRNGKARPVETIYGVNELYNVCKIHINILSSSVPINTKPAQKGAKLWVVGRNSSAKAINVQSVETFFNDYNFYVFDTSLPVEFDASPVVNQNGQIVAIAHISVNGNAATATDIHFPASFEITDALTVNDPTLRSTNIRVAFPKDKGQALAVLLLAGQRSDSLTRVSYIKDFIDKFPNEIEGYSTLAEEELKAQHFAIAESIMQSAMKRVKNKDEVHAQKAKLIYQKQVYFPEAVYTSWTIEDGLEELLQAQKINSLSQYKHQEAQLHVLRGDYQEAYQQFITLSQSEIRSGELFYEAAQCKQALNAPIEEYIALLDSAINIEASTAGTSLPPYLLSRAQAWAAAKNYRNAVKDYNMYDSIMGGRPLYSDFYYQRSQCELQIHQYQQALNDINRAIIVDRGNYLLWAEKASLHLRFKQYEEALRSSETCLLMDDKNTDAIIIKGISLYQLKRKKEGLAELEKAKQLGDERADAYIKKFK